MSRPCHPERSTGEAGAESKAPLQLTIEKLIYGGNGLARLTADEKGPGKAVFVPLVLEGERVEADITEHKTGFARGRATNILEPSLHRVAPACPYFGECGGCHYQHASYEHQLQIKSAILRETLRRVAKLELADEIQVHPSAPWLYRNRTRMRMRTKPFVLGYNRLRYEELIPIEQCPISSELINRAIAALWKLGRTGNVSAEVREIEFFTNADDTQLLIELTVEERGWWRRKSDLLAFVEHLRAALPEFAGVAVFHSPRVGIAEREEIPAELRKIFGAEEIVYETSGADYYVSAGAFFQTNRFLTDTLVAVVTGGVNPGGCALDLYAGAGLFTVPLARKFAEVGAVESAPFSFHDLRRNCPANVSCFRQPVEHFLETVAHDRSFDLIVVDPPRAGLQEKTARLLGGMEAARITYVSCDPATLARDLSVLTRSGYHIAEAHLVDLFPQTFHIESVFHLER